MKKSELFLILGVLAAATTLLFARLTADDLPAPGVMSGGDLIAYYFPALSFLRYTFLHGYLPLWNPYQLAGVPFAALHQTAAFYPLNLILLPLPPHLALFAHAVLHLMLAGFFTWLLARRLGLNSAGSVTAALAFVYSYPVLQGVYFPSFLSTYVWLPASFWALHRLFERPSLRRVAALSLVVTTLFLGGYAQGSLYVLQALGLYALFLLCRPAAAGGRAKIVAAVCAAALLALGLVSFQLLPTIEHAGLGVRSLGGLTLERAAAFSARADAVRAAFTGAGTGQIGLAVLSLPLFLTAVIGRRLRWHALFFLLLFVLVLDFMRGARGVLFPLYYALPLGDLFQAPLRMAFVYQFAAAMLIGIGASALVGWLARRRSVAIATAMILPVCVFADLSLRNPPLRRYEPLVNPESFYGPLEVAKFARESAGYERLFVQRQWGGFLLKLGMIHQIFVVPDYDAFLPGSYARFFGIPSGERWYGQVDVRSLGEHGAMLRQEPRLLDLLSVRYYYDAMEPGRPEFTRAFIERVNGRPALYGPQPVFRREEALRRTYVVHELVRVDSEEAALAKVRAGAFEPRRQVIVTDAVGDLEPERPQAREYARIEQLTPNRVEIEARCESVCLAVLTDLFHPGWQLEVDGQPVAPVRANYLFRGVRLESGTHQVVYRYAPRSFRIGAILSLAALAALGAAVAWPFAERFRGGRRGRASMIRSSGG